MIQKLTVTFKLSSSLLSSSWSSSSSLGSSPSKPCPNYVWINYMNSTSPLQSIWGQVLWKVTLLHIYPWILLLHYNLSGVKSSERLHFISILTIIHVLLCLPPFLAYRNVSLKSVSVSLHWTYLNHLKWVYLNYFETLNIICALMYTHQWDPNLKSGRLKKAHHYFLSPLSFLFQTDILAVR